MILRTHVGAGDGIVQTGMAVSLLDRIEGELWFPCYPQYLATFKSIFLHYPRIRIFTVNDRLGETWGSPLDRTYELAQTKAGISAAPILRCGVYNGRGCWEDFRRQFYFDAGIGFDARWTRCPIKEAAKTFLADSGNSIDFVWPAGKRRIFVHDDVQRNFRIRKLINREENYLFKPARDKVNISMLAYVPLIETAEEIHCIDSAFYHLIDSLAPIGRLYLHKYARWPRRNSFRYTSRLTWHYIE